ncbi:MAG: BrnT family toxin, partial [Deltaproteobacteria bacterium]|nr:BrnT family toxin [Deltaproteobacteria bacterium]
AYKAVENLKNHRVSFEEAKTVFNDPLLLTFPDQEHSDQEHRSISIGISSHSRILLLVHTGRSGKVRIISSRKATAKEKKLYET